MSAFTYELAAVHAAIQRAYPGHERGFYAVPLYLVLGEPGAGRSTALHAMGLAWPQGDGPFRTGLPTELCTYWIAQEAVFIEPESNVLGPRANPENLKALCDELASKRPREPIDGVLLVLSVTEFIDLDDQGLEQYANRLRKNLIEIGRRLRGDVPVYVLLTRYDTLWGFAQVFAWSADRAKEDPWGFTLPNDTPSQEALPRIQQELDGLMARLEAFCFAKLSSDDGPDQRMRAFQHLAEVRALMTKLRELFRIVAMTNAFERAPWIRAMAIGSAVPGGGDRLRAGVARFMNMGLGPVPAPAPGGRPGGLPFHAFMRTVILPERDLVPLRVRWRDDVAIKVCFILGFLLVFGAVVAATVFSRMP